MPVHPAHQPGYNYFLHRQHGRGVPEPPPRTSASGVLVMPEHTGTHIDALSHQAENLKLHGGIDVNSGVMSATGLSVLGVETMAPLVARGVLLGFTLPAHVLLLVRAGIPIIENLNLEELAAEGVHEFVFICLPLKMQGATGSPVRPIAIA